MYPEKMHPEKLRGTIMKTILAADIGGTNSRFAAFQDRCRPAIGTHPVTLAEHRRI